MHGMLVVEDYVFFGYDGFLLHALSTWTPTCLRVDGVLTQANLFLECFIDGRF